MKKKQNRKMDKIKLICNLVFYMQTCRAKNATKLKIKWKGPLLNDFTYTYTITRKLKITFQKLAKVLMGEFIKWL